MTASSNCINRYESCNCNNIPSTSTRQQRTGTLTLSTTNSSTMSSRDMTNSSSLRSIRRCMILLVLVVCMTAPSRCHGQQQQPADDGGAGKDLPEKGDTKCPSLADRYNSFANATSSSNGNDDEDAADVWLLPCKDATTDTDPNDGTTTGGSGSGSGSNDESNEREAYPNNTIVLSIYAALPAYASDFSNIFSWGVVGFLDEISLEYNVLSNFSVPVDLFNYTERRINPTNIDAHIIFQYVIATPIKINEASWWYQYQFIFYCFYGNAHINTNRTGKPIGNTDLIDSTDTGNTNEYKLKSIQQRLNYYIRYGVDIINLFNIRPSSYGILGLSTEDPTYSTTPFEDGPPTAPPTLSPSIPPLFNETTADSPINSGTTSPRGDGGVDRYDDNDEEDSMSPPSSSIPDGTGGNNNEYWNIDEGSESDYITYTSPVDVRLWDWRRFLGLITFISTLVSTIVLTQLASYRRRQIMEQTIWGNIGTEQGVEALLNTGWKFKDSTLMEVYNKAGMGYRDDDSMLLGGFEQTHTAAGGSSGDDDGGGGNASSSSSSPKNTESYGIGGEITIAQDGSVTTPET